MTRPAPRGVLRDADVLVDALDLPQNRIERVFEGAINRVALRGPQLVEVGVDPLAGLQLRLPVPTPQVAPYVFPRQHRLGDVVEHAGRDYIKDTALYTDILDRFECPQRLARACRQCPACSRQLRPLRPGWPWSCSLLAVLRSRCRRRRQPAPSRSASASGPTTALTLAATWYEPPSRPAPAVIYVHMLQKSRRDWDQARRTDWRPKASAGWPSTCAGTATSPGSPQDYAGMVQDVRAARRFLSLARRRHARRASGLPARRSARRSRLWRRPTTRRSSASRCCRRRSTTAGCASTRPSRSSARVRCCSSPATTTGMPSRSVRDLRKGRRRHSRSRHPQPRRARHGDAGERCRPRRAACWSGSDERCYDRGRRSLRQSAYPSVTENQSSSASPACSSASSSAGSSAASRARRRARLQRRLRPQPRGDVRPVVDGGAARRGARRDARAGRRTSNPRDVQARARARQPLLRLRALRGRRALVRAGARDRAAQRQREHRPRHRLLLHEPAGPGAAAVRSLAGHRSAPHEDASQRRHRAGVRQRRSRRARRRPGSASSSTRRTRRKASARSRRSTACATRTPTCRADRARPPSLQGRRLRPRRRGQHGHAPAAAVPADSRRRPRRLAAGQGRARGRGLSPRRWVRARSASSSSAIRSAAPTCRRRKAPGAADRRRNAVFLFGQVPARVGAPVTLQLQASFDG